MDPPTDLVHGPLYGPVHRPPLWVPMKTIIKMTVRDFDLPFFVCLVFVIVASFTVTMKGGPAYIYVGKDR